jgi:hypothetical protein
MGVWSGVGGVLQTSGLAGNIIAKALVHGVVGGALAVAQGGDFTSGFVANAIGAAAGFITQESALGSISGNEGVLARTAIAAAAGGTASVLTGGKFANGAITGAMAHLFNFESHTARAAIAAAGAGTEMSMGAGIAAGLTKLLGIVTLPLTIGGDTRQSDDPYVNIYRAIDDVELDYLKANGNYGHNPSMSGKYFALTLGGAQAFAGWSQNEAATVTGTSIPRSVLEQGHLFNDPGVHGAGPSVHFSDTVLPRVYRTMTPPHIHSPGS